MEGRHGICMFFIAFLLITNPVISFENGKLYGVSQIAITVDNLQYATGMYVDTLGGMLVESLSTTGVWGDELFYSMFQKDIMAAEAAGASFDSFGICDIRNNGNYKVAWNFILFDSNLIQLVECRVRSDTITPKVFTRINTGAAKIGTSGHLCLWASPDAVSLQQVEDILTQEKEASNPYVGFITGFDVATEAIRNSLSPSNYLMNLGDFDIAAFRGREGTHIEISFRRYASNAANLKGFCENKAVSTLMLRPSQDNMYHNRPSKNMAGFHHISLTVDDIDQANKFYTQVLGGISQGGFPPIPAGPGLFDNIYFQDDRYEAAAKNVAADPTYGVLPSLAVQGSGAESHITFTLMDNILLEHYAFTGTDISQTYNDARYLSPGYTRSFVTGFWVMNDVDLNQYIKDMEAKSATLGMTQVKANRPIKVNTFGDSNIPLTDYSRQMNSSGIKGDVAGLEGYSFVYFKGPSGETQALTQFTGSTREALKTAMLKYGAVSTAFPETNPWNYQGFDLYCNQINNTGQQTCDCKDCCSQSNASNHIQNMGLTFSLILTVILLFSISAIQC